MKIALFLPCYVDQFYPRVGIATLRLLEKLGCDVEYPLEQTCCGQPMANSGCERDAVETSRHFVRTFGAYEYVVAPSGSCVYHVRKHYDLLEQTETVRRVRQRTLELSEFLLDVLRIERLDSVFPHRVGLHQSCHGLRGLHLGAPSERMDHRRNNAELLLRMVDGLELATLERYDECCGFGGTFSITEPEVSVKMGLDRLADHERHDVEVLTSADMSCLMHLEGLARRKGSGIRVMHLAEILNGNS
jgi:L-lactate dehydrogenase complex protein LldE